MTQLVNHHLTVSPAHRSLLGRRTLAASVAGGLVVLPLGVYLWAIGPLGYYIGSEFPAGQSAYIMMRPAGHIAFGLVFIQLVLGMHARPIGRWLGLASMAPLHRRLGLVTLWFVLLHPLLFVWARSLRSGQFDFIVTFAPNPLENYWERMLFVGALAMYALIFGVVAALYGPRLAPRYWRVVHSVNVLAFGLAFWHAISVGSETRLQPVEALHWAMAVSVCALLILRFARAASERLRGAEDRSS